MQIKELVIYSDHLGEQFAFYTQTLGFQPVAKSTTSFAIKAGHSVLHFEQNPKPQPFAPYHFAFNIDPASIHTVVPFLQSRRIQPLEANGNTIQDFTDWNAKAVYCYDADGNIVEFIARFNLGPQTPHQPFDESKIWNISEMGIVVPDIPDFLRQIHNHLGLSVWKESGPDFKAVGSETLLLVTVPPGRNWFPTTIPAASLPATIKLDAPFPVFTYGNYQIVSLAND